MRETLDQIEAMIQGPVGFDPAASEAGFRIFGSDFFAELLMPQLADRLQIKAPYMRVHLVDLALSPEIDLPDWVGSHPVF